MGEIIQLTAGDGHQLGAYRANPEGTPKAGLVLLQEIFGVNSHIRSVCDGYAAAGYLVVAPALFDRVKPGIELPYDDDGRTEGFATREKTNFEQNLADAAAAQAVVKEAGKTAILGFCWGGAIAWQSASKLNFDASVLFYGGGIAEHLDLDANCPVQMHFGEDDQGIPMTDVEKIKAAKPDIPVHTYAGAGHGFCCDQRGSYHAEATRLGKERTLAFLAEHLG